MSGVKSAQPSSQAPIQQNRKLNATSTAAKSTNSNRDAAVQTTHTRGTRSSAASSIMSNVSHCHTSESAPIEVAAAARDRSKSPPPLDSDEETSSSDVGSEETYEVPDSPRSDAASRYSENASWAQLPPSASSYTAPAPLEHDDCIMHEQLVELEHNSDMEANYSINKWLGDDQLKRMGGVMIEVQSHIIRLERGVAQEEKAHDSKSHAIQFSQVAQKLSFPSRSVSFKYSSPSLTSPRLFWSPCPLAASKYASATHYHGSGGELVSWRYESFQQGSCCNDWWRIWRVVGYAVAQLVDPMLDVQTCFRKAISVVRSHSILQVLAFP
nr:hypothetical protein CFP56_00723 [Quercus suber]